MMLAIFCALTLQAQTVEFEASTPLELALDAHFRVARIERELAFFDAYAAAGEEARARAILMLERLRTPGSASDAPSDSQTVARAMAALAPQPEGLDAEQLLARERLQALVDAFELEPAPGVFEGAAARAGRLMRVEVASLYMPPASMGGTLSLLWTGPDGAQHLGYRGSVGPEVFGPKGFAVELPLPGHAPGSWSLAIEIERNGVSARRAGTQVECVDDLEARAHAQFDDLEDPTDPRMPLAVWMSILTQRGLHTLARVSAAEQLARLEGRTGDHGAYPWAFAFESADGSPRWIWRRDPPGEARGTLLLLAPTAEPAEASLSRKEWSRLSGWRVLSTHIPGGAGKEGSTAALFARITAKLEAAGERGPIVCVTRGDSLGRLAMAFHGASERPYAAEVLSTCVVVEDPTTLLGPMPRLILAPGGRASLAEAKLDERSWWIDSASLPLIADFELPARLEAALAPLEKLLFAGTKAPK